MVPVLAFHWDSPCIFIAPLLLLGLTGLDCDLSTQRTIINRLQQADIFPFSIKRKQLRRRDVHVCSVFPPSGSSP